MSSDLGYINARVRGLKSQLLGPEFYNDALNATDFRAFTSIILSVALHARLRGGGGALRGLARHRRGAGGKLLPDDAQHPHLFGRGERSGLSPWCCSATT